MLKSLHFNRNVYMNFETLYVSQNKDLNLVCNSLQLEKTLLFAWYIYQDHIANMI